jgi:hypothetical protein
LFYDGIVVFEIFFEETGFTAQFECDPPAFSYREKTLYKMVRG